METPSIIGMLFIAAATAISVGLLAVLWAVSGPAY